MSDTDNAAQPAHGELVEWKELSSNALDVMKELGDFGPTVHPANVEVKGYLHEEGRTYWTSDDLRKIAAGCSEVADWLDKRAARTGARDE